MGRQQLFVHFLSWGRVALAGILAIFNLLEYAIPPPFHSSQKIQMAISRGRREVSEIRWCQNDRKKILTKC